MTLRRPLPRALRVLLLASASLLAAHALAATVYIRDQLYVPLRSMQSENARIIHRGILSGTPLELLERNEETGYSHVRMENGTEGWIQTQYLTDKPIARDRLKELEQRYTRLEKELTDARASISEQNQENASLRDENETLATRNKDATNELSRITSLATDAMQLDQTNKALKQENKTLAAELDNLTNLNMELKERKDQEWFWLGAGTVLVSVLLGIWIGRKIYLNRKTGGWS